MQGSYRSEFTYLPDKLCCGTCYYWYSPLINVIEEDGVTKVQMPLDYPNAPCGLEVSRSYRKNVHFSMFCSYWRQRINSTNENKRKKEVKSSNSRAVELFNSGIYHYTGNGVKQDYVKAAECWSMAAAMGYDPAECNLAVCYLRGDGVKQDQTKAFGMFYELANKGNLQAQCALAQCYFHGNGVKQDYAKAFEWHSRAAVEKYAESQHELGVFYANGYGVKQDKEKAIYWFRKAAQQDYQRAKDVLKKHFGIKV